MKPEKAMSDKKEQAKLACSDAKVFHDLADQLLSFDFAVEVCGHDGDIEMQIANSIARDAIKRLVNYI
jgi:hypothetical protein